MIPALDLQKDIISQDDAKEIILKQASIVSAQDNYINITS